MRPALLTPIAIADGRQRANDSPGSSAIEIIVNADGLVHSVKAIGQPSTVGEALETINWLSITKSWRFDPAKRNGQPVRYRLVVPLGALISGRGLK